ncbi:PDZ domain-containing protein [Flavobacterium cerinum]|uniref:PDZ domain-containing protein n=1 Tax=Flavobacterium cerinum TaxID=2502784 RepID=A0ABY5IQS1_9FLAO|nr:PDZ domain-containing protein [Flavobacterium cerinum]UUC45196.1 PDZ domain-containing protein [Flavobacterium cerinum]
MKKMYFIFLILFIAYSYGQVTSNSKWFQVNEYYTIGNSGKYELYKTHGFVENVPDNKSGRIFIMPIIEIDDDDIKYFDSDGNAITSNGNIYSISIPITFISKLPTKYEIPSIGSNLDGISILAYYRPLLKDNFGNLIIHPNAAGFFSTQIYAQTQKYEESLKKQNELSEKYKSYKPELVSLSEVQITLEIDDDVVYNKSYYGTYIGNNKISFKNPSNYVKNRIASGDYSIYISYKFRDSQNSYVDATFDAKTIVNQFLDEAQKSMVSQSSSGWSFLGFGSRRKSIKSSFNYTAQSNYKGATYSSTSVEMFDADDRMIQQFENAFFPILSQSQAIENHLKAAEIAKLEGNIELQKIHDDYVKSLQNNDPNLEVDIAKAAAALSRKDYVGFIANGVRWGDYKVKGNNDFRRVIVDNNEFEQHKDWSQLKRVSVQHSITEKINSQKDVNYKGDIGLIGGIPHQFYGHLNSNGFVYYNQLFKGIILGGIAEGSALHRRNIVSGTFITSINGNNVYDSQSFINTLRNINPDDDVILKYIELNGSFYVEKSVMMKADSIPDL